MADSKGSSGGGFPLKLLIDCKRKKVIFAEAGKELVDLFFSFSLLPLGVAVCLLGKDGCPGSIGELHESICKLDGRYFCAGLAALPSEVKEELICPSFPRHRLKLGNLIPLPQSEQKRRVRQLKIYACSFCKRNASDVHGASCPSCPIGKMGNETNLHLSGTAESGDEKKGFVKELVTYAITDDLSIVPLSSLSFMKRLHVYSLVRLQEKTVMVGVEQALKILGISLRSKTDVFLSSD